MSDGEKVTVTGREASGGRVYEKEAEGVVDRGAVRLKGEGAEEGERDASAKVKAVGWVYGLRNVMVRSAE